MRIARELYDEMVAHAREEAPNECCGMVASSNGVAQKVYPAVNAAASPLRYEIDGAEQYRIQMEIDDAGHELGAIYHSHVASEARPSPTDERQAFFPPGEFDREPAYPQTLYILVSLVEEPPSVRAWRVEKGPVVTEEPIEVM